MPTFYIQAAEGPMSVIDSEIIYIILLQLLKFNCFIKIISASQAYFMNESFRVLGPSQTGSSGCGHPSTRLL